MKVILTKKFDKYYRKRILPNPLLDSRYGERFLLFVKNPKHPILKDHALSGKLFGKRAFWITGDIRVIYYIEEETTYFVDIGSHNQVYR